MCGGDDRQLARAKHICEELGKKGREPWADLVSPGCGFVIAPHLSGVRPLCDPATFVTSGSARYEVADHCLRQRRLPSANAHRPGPLDQSNDPEPDDKGVLESEYIWRARLARSVFQAQANAVTSLRSRLATSQSVRATEL